MSWRDDFRRGSFRGVPFKTAESNVEGGRRGETHEFPQSDKPYREDLGRMARQFSLDVFVDGDDYFDRRNALIAACEADGPGTLIHPFLGEMTVALIDYSLAESGSSGGIAEFSLTFTETSGSPASASASTDTAALARAEAERVRQTAPTDFLARFSVDALPGFIEGAAAQLVTEFATLSAFAAAPLAGGGTALRSFETALRLLPATALTLVRVPLSLGQQVGGLMSSMMVLTADPRRRAAAARTMMSYGSGFEPVSGTTAPRRAQTANQAAFVALVQTLAAAELVAALADTRFASYDDAIAERSDAADRIDAIADAAADVHDDRAWHALRGLRTAMVRDLTERGATLSRVYTHETRLTEPALVIARRLTEDARQIGARADDLVTRNRLRHPGFVAGGIALQVVQERAAA